MKYLSAEAAKCYYSLSVDVADYRLILIPLHAMCAPDDPVRDQIESDLRGHNIDVLSDALADDEQTNGETLMGAPEATAILAVGSESDFCPLPCSIRSGAADSS